LQCLVDRQLALVALDDGDQDRPADDGHRTDQSRFDRAERTDEIPGQDLLGDSDHQSWDGTDGLPDALARFGQADADGQGVVDLICHPLPEGGELQDVGDGGGELDIGHLHAVDHRRREGRQCRRRGTGDDDARGHERGGGGQAQTGCECMHVKLLTEREPKQY